MWLLFVDRKLVGVWSAGESSLRSVMVEGSADLHLGTYLVPYVWFVGDWRRSRPYFRLPLT